MGRKKLNRTKEELAEMNRKRQRRFYKKNRVKIIAKKMKEYWEKKNEREKMEKELP